MLLKKHLWVFIFLLGFGLRYYGIDSKPFHEDESWTLHHITHFSILQLLFQHYELLSPPLFYFLTKGVTFAFGVSEFSLRFLSALCSSLSVVLIYKIGKTWKSESVGLTAALLFCFSPLALVYAQTARTYGLFGLLAILSLFFVLKYFQTQRRLFFVAFFICIVLGMFTHFLFATLFAADTLFFLLIAKKMGRKEAVKWLTACFILCMVFLPLYLMALHQWQYETPSEPLPFWVRFFLAFFGLVLGETIYPFNWAVVIPAVIFFGAAFGLGLYFCFRSQDKGWPLILLNLIVPLTGWLCLRVDTLRHLSYAVPFFLLVVSFGVQSIETRSFWKNIFIFLLAMPLMLSSYYWYSGNPEQVLNSNLIIPWREIASDVESLQKPGDLLLLHPAFQSDFMEYYKKEGLSGFILLPEEHYEQKLQEVLKTKPAAILLLMLPNTSRDKKIKMDPFACYGVTYQKGYVLNPILTEHFKTGKKRFAYAASLKSLQRLDSPSCL